MQAIGWKPRLLTCRRQVAPLAAVWADASFASTARHRSILWPIHHQPKRQAVAPQPSVLLGRMRLKETNQPREEKDSRATRQRQTSSTFTRLEFHDDLQIPNAS